MALPRNTHIATRSARRALKPSKQPYWSRLHKGAALGYYKGARGASWQVRRITGLKRVVQTIGQADDHDEANGVTILSYKQAMERAMSKEQSVATMESTYTVETAVEDYLENKGVEAGETAEHDARQKLEKHVVPKFGKRRVESLTTQQLTAWRNGIAGKNAKRAAKSSANRIVRQFKAVLNFAYKQQRVKDRAAWDRLEQFPKVEEARIRMLTVAECTRLVNAADPEFRPLVRAALLTGRRYGDIRTWKVRDFHADSRTIGKREGKSQKVKHVDLTDEGVQFFTEQTAGRSGKEFMLTRDDGQPWKQGMQIRRMKAASENGNIDPTATFHDLRHAYGSLLALAGVPLQVIAKALGHADSRLTERYYAHLQPDHVADAINRALPKFLKTKKTVSNFRQPAR